MATICASPSGGFCAGLGGLRRIWAEENGSHRGGPPLAADLGGFHAIGVEPAGDSPQALARRVLVAYAGDDLRWERRFAAGTRGRQTFCSGRPPSFGQEALEFVNRDEARASVHFQGFDVGQDASVEG